jgi:epsilon-lactone hydrolase
VASRLFGPQRGLPPLLIQVGSVELLLSDSERLAEAAREAGVDVALSIGQGRPHVYQGALTTGTTAASGEIAAFAKRLPAASQRLGR